jgi:geranylgeranyl pyrophosphate synthase
MSIYSSLAMETTEKFSSKMSKKTLKALREFAAESGRPISSILSDAVSDYLTGVRIRPAFLTAASKVVDEHEELLKKLAQ